MGTDEDVEEGSEIFTCTYAHAWQGIGIEVLHFATEPMYV